MTLAPRAVLTGPVAAPSVSPSIPVQLEAVAQPAFCSLRSEGLPSLTPGQVPRVWQLGWGPETSSRFGETKAEDGGRGDNSRYCLAL